MNDMLPGPACLFGIRHVQQIFSIWNETAVASFAIQRYRSRGFLEQRWLLLVWSNAYKKYDEIKKKSNSRHAGLCHFVASPGVTIIKWFLLSPIAWYYIQLVSKNNTSQFWPDLTTTGLMPIRSLSLLTQTWKLQLYNYIAHGSDSSNLSEVAQAVLSSKVGSTLWSSA